MTLRLSVQPSSANLCANAATHAPHGGEVRLIGRVQGPLVQVEVADDGEGLGAGRVQQLLQPFGEESLTRRDAVGFGWMIVQALCAAMGARFEVVTAPGEGLSAILSFRRAR